MKKASIAVNYAPSDEISYGVIEAYEWLLRNPKSNLGWRILAEVYFDEKELRRIVQESEKGLEIVKLLDAGFVTKHQRVLELIQAIRKEELALSIAEAELKSVMGGHFDEIVEHFAPKEEEKSVAIDKTKPTVLLTSFVGCKGLSAGHVFIVGANNGSIPRDPGHINEVEISQFIVALTRTRKRCQIVSNAWLVSPVDKNKQYLPRTSPSIMISWISKDLIEDRGKVKAGNLAK